jgi:hypothetical protein
LALHFNYGSKLVGDSTWREIKKKPVFDFDEPNLLIEPLTGFIRDWTRSLPRELSTLGSSDKDQATPPELADFVELNQSLMRFDQKSLPVLRKAAQTFVSCVHSMNLEPHQAWSQIWDTQGDGAGGEQKVNWGALHALDKFTQDFRSQEGEGLEHIISPLAASEQMVRTAFSTAVWKDFTATWNAVMSKYEKQGFQVSFPFMPHAEKEAPLGDLMNFFQDLEALAETFHLMPKADDGKQPAVPPAAAQGGQAVFPMAKRMIKDMQAGQRKRFLDLCLGFRSFIEGRSLEKPLVIKAAMVPGVVGHYVHWVRVAFADGTHYDLNVYGKPPVEIPVQGREGSVTFEGLDVNKIPTTAFTMTQGDLALLQLPYAFGVPQDLDRKHWLVEGRLPSIEEPGKMIPFQLNLLFNQGTPEPLFWPERAQ